MSILLEALRKSEKGQAPVEPPTIHTDQHVSVPSEPLRKGPVTVLILLALSLIAWIVWRQYEPLVVKDQPLQAALAEQKNVVPIPIPAIAAVDATPGPADSSRVASTTGRTPVERYQAGAPGNISAPGGASSSRPAASKPTANEPEASPDDDADRLAGTSAAKAPASADVEQAKHPQPISYWELPDAIRADVPAIKFTVLVYAGEPANRFVLVNGQRLTEGDSYQPGLVVEEIQRNGVVFSYRLYRFLVER